MKNKQTNKTQDWADNCMLPMENVRELLWKKKKKERSNTFYWRDSFSNAKALHMYAAQKKEIICGTKPV